MMSKKSFFSLLIVFSMCFQFLPFSGMMAFAVPFSSTKLLDGSNDFKSQNDPQRSANETFVTSTPNNQMYVSWDATNLYVGYFANDVFNELYGSLADKWLWLYIGGAGGTRTGANYSGQQPALPFDAKYHFRFKADGTFTNMMVFNGTSWVSSKTYGSTGTVGRTQFSGFVEFKIPRADFGLTTTGTLPMVASLAFEDTVGNNDRMQGALPADTFFNGDGFDRDFSTFYEFDLNSENTAAASQVYNYRLRTVSTTSTTANLSFANMSDASQYGIQQSTDNGATWTNASLFSLGTTSAVVRNLTAGVNYKFRLIAIGGANAGSSAVVNSSVIKLEEIKVGDYVQFGKYNNAPILWRVISRDANGDPMLLADRILTLKAFDASGSYHVGDSTRLMNGSNYYLDSNIRQWLNSSIANNGSNLIDWIQNDPIAENLWLGHNPYNREKGFLADGNFTATERNLIKPLSHKVVIAGVDAAKKEGGTGNHTYSRNIINVVQNYDTTANYQSATDNVFLLSVKQLKEFVYDNSSVLGTNYHIAKPTIQAVEQSTFKDSVNLNSNNNFAYLLNSAFSITTDGVRYVRSEGTVEADSAFGGAYGIRPALQLNLSSVVFSSGTGEFASPFVIGASAAADIESPSTPSLNVSNVTGSNATLNWTASTDNVGVSVYEIYNNTTLLQTVAGSTLSYSFTSLTAGTNYSFSVRAKDAVGNVSGFSNLVAITTKSAPTGIMLSNLSIAENATANTVVGTLSSTDVDAGDSFGYFLVAGTGSTDNSSFNIFGNQLRISSSFDFETKNTYSIRVRSTDSFALSFEQTFTITVTNVNEVPTISDIVNQSTSEDTAASSIAFTVADVETSAGSLTVSGNSSNTTLVPNANIVFGGTGANRTVTVTPAANQNGTATITVTVSDGTLTATDTFVLTVTAANDAPTISDVANQATNEDTATSAIAITVGDVETATASLTMSGSSSNTTLVPNANIVFGGTGANRTVTVTPAANQIGTATITVTVSDGTLTAIDTFVLTVNAVNDAPTISDIANQSTNEDIATSAISFTIGDAETAVASLTMSGSSSDTTLVPNANIVFGGTGANRTVTVMSAANQNGTATITITVSDGSLTANDTFVLTVTAVNDEPTISDVANQATNEDTATSAIAITVGDVETATASLTMSGSSSNTTLVPNANIVFGGTGANRTVTITPVANQNGTATITLTVSDGTLTAIDTFVLTVTAVNDAPTLAAIPNQIMTEDTTATIPLTASDVDDTTPTLSVSGGSVGTVSASISGTTLTLTPAANYNTASAITFTVTASDGNLTATQTFTVTVTAVNDVPTISDITDQSTNEDTPTNAVVFTISDVETAFASLTVSGSSSNTTLVPNANIVFGGSGATRTVIVTPAVKQNGMATITVTVSDGSFTATDTFTLTVNENNAPTISNIPDQFTNEDEATIAIPFMVGDAETTAGSLTVSGSSSNTTLVPDANIVFGGSGANRTVTITPVAKQNGMVTITVTMSDGSLTTSDTFVLKVTAVNDAPTSIALYGDKVVENVWIGFDIGEFTAIDIDQGDNFIFSLVDGEGDTDNANFKIEDGKLKAAIVFDYLEKSLHSIRVRVTDADGLYFEQAFEVEVIQSNAFLNATNKVVTIFFKDAIVDNSSSFTTTPKPKLKDLIKITRNANADEPTYEALGPNDTVAVKGNRLIVIFENQVTGYYNRIKIEAEALKDRLGYKSAEQVTTPLVVDTTGPALINVTMDKKKKELTLQFSERVYMATTGANAKEITETFNAAITFSRDGGSFQALNARDKVSLSGRSIKIKLLNPLTTNDNKIKIAADSLRDLIGNLAEEIETPEIDLDAKAPVLSKVTLAPDNKTIVIQMNEETSGTVTGSKAVKTAALRAAIQLSTNANAASPTYAALTAGDSVELQKGVLTIKLATALTGAHNRIRLGAGLMKDIFGNTNGELTTSVLAADKVGPTFVSTALPLKKANRMLVITMNEAVSNGFTSGKTTENRAALKNAITLKSDDGEFMALKAADRVKVSGKTLQITFATALVKDKNYQVKIATNALQDLTGNKGEEIITDTLVIDTTGPKMR